MIDRDTARRRFEALLDAMDSYQAANSDEARGSAEEKALKARKAIDEETGITLLRHRRMVAEALGHSNFGTAPVEADDFGRFINDCLDAFETPAARQRLRHAFARYILDDEAALTERFARLLTEKTLANAKGFLGALDRVEGSSGVEPSGGLAEDIRTNIVSMAGYTAGFEFDLAGRIPRKLWARAERAHAHLASEGCARGHKIQKAKAETIKIWCQKEARFAALFNDARREGASSRGERPVNRQLLLGV